MRYRDINIHQKYQQIIMINKFSRENEYPERKGSMFNVQSKTELTDGGSGQVIQNFMQGGSGNSVFDCKSGCSYQLRVYVGIFKCTTPLYLYTL